MRSVFKRSLAFLLALFMMAGLLTVGAPSAWADSNGAFDFRVLANAETNAGTTEEPLYTDWSYEVEIGGQSVPVTDNAFAYHGVTVLNVSSYVHTDPSAPLYDDSGSFPGATPPEVTSATLTYGVTESVSFAAPSAPEGFTLAGFTWTTESNLITVANGVVTLTDNAHKVNAAADEVTVTATLYDIVQTYNVTITYPTVTAATVTLIPSDKQGDKTIYLAAYTSTESAREIGTVTFTGTDLSAGLFADCISKSDSRVLIGDASVNADKTSASYTISYLGTDAEGTTKYTVSASAHGKSDSKDFYVDNVGPKGTAEIVVVEGETALLSTGFTGATGYNLSINGGTQTNIVIEDSFTVAKGDTIKLDGYDASGNGRSATATVYAVSVEDQTAFVEIEGNLVRQSGDGVYFNGGNKSVMKLPITLDPAEGAPTVSAFEGFTLDGNNVVWAAAQTEGSISADDFSGKTVTYKGTNVKVTVPVSSELTKSYVLDSTDPTVTAIAEKGKFYQAGTDWYLGVPAPYKQGSDTITLTTEDNEGGSGIAEEDDLKNKEIGVEVSVNDDDTPNYDYAKPSENKVSDRSGNESQGWILKNEEADAGTLVSADITATPIVPAWASGITPAADDETWYSEDINVSFTVNPGKDYTTGTGVPFDPSKVEATFNGSADKATLTGEVSNSAWTGVLSTEGIEAKDAEFVITVTSVLSERVKQPMTTTTTVKYNVDTVAPRVSASIDGTPQNDKYFKADRTLTVEVEDLNAFTGVLKYSVGGTNNTVEFTESPFTQVFSDDGDYQIVGLTVTDAHGNKTELDVEKDIAGKAPNDFVIDQTPAAISVSFDNNAVENESYFKAERTATITVTEHNFNADDVTIDTTGTVGTWTDDGDTHTIEVAFTEEGEHSFAISMKDLAGNESAEADFGNSASPEAFTIDMTAPKLSVALDRNDEIRNDRYISAADRTLTVTVEDVNMAKDAGGEASFLRGSETFGTDGLTYKFEGDGVYGLMSVFATDLAGNISSVEFTANDAEPTLVGDVTVDAVSAFDFVLDKTAPEMTVRLTSGEDVEVGGIKIFQKGDTEEDDPGKYYLVFETDTDAVTDDNQTDLEVTLDLRLSDVNLVAGDLTEVQLGGINAYYLRLKENSEDEFEYVSEEVVPGIKQTEGANGTIEYNASFTVKANEACYIEYAVTVVDLAGNPITADKVKTEAYNGGTDAGYGYDPVVDENGTVSNTFAFDRRQASTELDSGVPDIVFVRDLTPVTDVLYSDDVTYTVEIADGEEESEYNKDTDQAAAYRNFQHVGLKSVEYTVENGTGEGKITISRDKRTAEGTIKISPDNDEANGIVLTITAIDRAGNRIIRKDTIDIDKLAPRVTFSYNNNESRDGGEYFNAPRTATITVEDINFTSGKVVVNGAETELQVGANTVAFPGPDTDYTVSFTTEDRVASNTDDAELKAAHTTDSEKNTEKLTIQGTHPWKFTVDTVAPVLTVFFDNNEARNGSYYKAPRTAMATINERNFDTNDVVFNNQGAACALTGWTNANPHTSSVPCLTDGVYHFTIAFQDKAGNQAQMFDSNGFTIDLTAPTVEITNIEPFSANRGAVTPRITFSDTNFDPQGYKVSVVMVNMADKTEVTLSSSTTDIENGVQIDFDDLAETKANDGIYTITATITDLAGNTSEASVTYSVNRKGSTYYAYDDATKALLSGVYSSKAPTLMIAEVNPDDLESYSVTVNVNNKSTKLTEGADFKFDRKGGNDSFHEYIYTINSSVFMKDGKLIEGDYSIVFDSTDSAGNINSNRANEGNAPVNFTLDETPPILSITGIMDKERIQEASRNVTVIFQDGTAVAKVEIYLNGELIKTIEGDELRELKDSYSFDIEQANVNQNLRVVATDVAGNSSEAAVSDFYINSSAMRQFVHNTPLFVGSLAGLALVAGGLFFLLGRKKKDKAEAK